MIFYNYDTNTILVELLKEKKVETLTAAWIKAHKQLKNNGHATELYILDNEYLADLKDAMINKEIKF